MQPRSTAILFVMASFLGAFVYLYEIQGEAGREEAEVASRRIFPGVEAESIESLEFRSQDDRLVASVRKGDGWLLLKPVEFPGDEVNLDAIASTLANLTSEDTLESAGAREIYGLGTSARRIQFRVGEQEYMLEIGADTPVGGNVYAARVPDEKRIFTIALFRASSLNRDLDSLRDRRVLSFDRTRVSRIVAGWPGGAVTLEKSATGWTIVDPAGISGPADDNVDDNVDDKAANKAANNADDKAVDDLLSDVAFLRAESFVDEARGDFEAGASEPYFTLRLELEDGEGTSLEAGILVVPDPDGEDFIVRGGQARTLYRVPRSRIESFPRDVFSYRFKELSNFDTTRVQSFELVFASEAEASSMEPVTVRVDRVETGWRSTGEPWAVGAAAGLIAEFARLQAIAVVSEDADGETLASLGLLPPRVMLRAYTGPGNAAPNKENTAEHEPPVAETRELLAEVSLGNFDPDSGIYARASGQKTIFRLDAELAEQIPVGLESYRSRFLAPPAAQPDGESGVQPPPQ